MARMRPHAFGLNFIKLAYRLDETQIFRKRLFLFDIMFLLVRAVRKLCRSCATQNHHFPGSKCNFSHSAPNKTHIELNMKLTLTEPAPHEAASKLQTKLPIKFKSGFHGTPNEASTKFKMKPSTELRTKLCGAQHVASIIAAKPAKIIRH